ncbi:hypothetical protein D2M30_2041 [Bacillus amyloliquefaciens]|nr:hypothetical protein [Bacillus amyloliquefaciens]QBG56370.1 hypothetical protein D2M30_2041 [Bacillus amyloliquefaciens]
MTTDHITKERLKILEKELEFIRYEEVAAKVTKENGSCRVLTNLGDY